MKKLASKLQADPGKDDDSGDEFNRKLKEIMHRYKINNEAFASEILNLHLNLKD